MRNLQRTLFQILLLCIAVGLLAGCGGAKPAAAPEPPPYWPTDGWRTSTPEAQGMDSKMLANMLKVVLMEHYDVDSVLVVRHGHLVLDVYVYPFQANAKHPIHSCTKSITSILIGIAVAEGHIEGVDQPVLSFFSERTAANIDADKQAMTLEHLLTMASGLDCRDSYLYRWQGLDQMGQNDDWVQYMLDLPMAEPPGTRFEYCNGASFLLSAILQETTGMSARDFAEDRLFAPLGISDLVWPANPQGISIGWGQMQMRPHDMAKIGFLYLNQGRWNGKQLVPTEWVAASTRQHIDATLQDGYGYQWWVRDDGVYMALGYAGQFIYVVPDKDMVVVFTSHLDERDFYVPQGLLDDYIIPAARSAAPLPENRAGTALLQARTVELAEP